MTDKQKKEILVEGVDKDDNKVKTLLKRPTAQDYRDSQVQYNETFRKALDSGALLRQKLTDYMKDQGIWDDEKQKKNDQYIKDISAREDALKAGGMLKKFFSFTEKNLFQNMYITTVRRY